MTDDGRMHVKEHGQTVAEIPTAALTDGAPVYERPMTEPAYIAEAAQLALRSLGKPPAPSVVFTRLLASPTIASKRWVYRQYDHMVRTNTLVVPGMGAGVVRVKGTGRALALSVDGNGRYVYLDPFLGAQLAVAEAARNVACAGAEPVGATNCLNFGNPERPEIMWQFARAVDGLATACRALDIPITGGNVSLYNETDGRAVLPTPVLGVVGIIEDDSRVVRRTFQREGDVIVLLGTSANELGGSEYLKTIHGLVRGRPPALDLGREAALQRLIVDAIAQGLIRSAHDCAEGGLAITIAECCFDTGLGALADLPAVDVDAADFCDISTLFNESASRVVASADPQAAERLVQLAEKRSVPARVIGRVGGDRIRIGIDGRRVIDEPVVGAERIWADTIGAYFESQRAIA